MIKKIIIILSLLLPVVALAARFEFTNGVPNVVADPTGGNNTDFSTRYDFRNGVPAVLFDSTAALSIPHATVTLTQGTGALKSGTLLQP